MESNKVLIFQSDRSNLYINNVKIWLSSSVVTNFVEYVSLARKIIRSFVTELQ